MANKECDQVDLFRIKEELADIFSFAFLLAHKHNLDVKEIISKD
jgi:NTP pyrophosphatase (non-canonical NTP hydrolase)